MNNTLPPQPVNMSPPPSPPPPPLPDTSPPDSPPQDRRYSQDLPPPPIPPLDPTLISPLTSTDDEGSDEYDEESDESYFYSDSDPEEEKAEIRKPKVSTTSCYEVNASPQLSENEHNADTPRKNPYAIKEIHSSRRGSAAREDKSSRRGSHALSDKSSRRGSAAPDEKSDRKGTTGRVRKKKKRGGPRVSKYKENNKTVRQHIKPGTVEDLATLFTGWNHENEEKEEDIVRSNSSLHKYGSEAGYGSVNHANGDDREQEQHLQRQYQQRERHQQSQSRIERKSPKGNMDFIAASKSIQERLILSRNNSLHRPSPPKLEDGLDSNVTATTITNENKARNSNNNELPDSTQTNIGLDYEISVANAKNTKSSQSVEEEKIQERRETELERTNMTDGLQTNNEHKVHEGKQKHLWRNDQGPFKLIMSKGGKSMPSGISGGREEDKLDKKTSKSEGDINKVMASQQNRYEPISIDKITLSERIQAVNSSPFTHSSTHHNYSNDLQPARHSRDINNAALLSTDNVIKTGLGENDVKHPASYNAVYNSRQTDGHGNSRREFSSESRNKMKTMTSEVDSGVSEETDVCKNNGSGWDSVSNSTVSVQDGDDRSLSKLNVDESWITVDVPLDMNGCDSDEERTNGTSNNVHISQGTVGISDVINGSGHEVDKTISTLQTSISKNYITTSVERETKVEAVTKPFENTFVTTESLNQPEHSANVNMQLLKNLQSQTREGSRPDLFAHSTRVWSGKRGDDDDGDGDGDGGGGGKVGRDEGGGGGRRMMEAADRDDVIRGDIQTNKRPVLLHSQTEHERTEHTSSDSFEITTTSNSNRVDSGQDVITSDDFQSVLDDISIQDDTTSYFLKNRNKLNSKEKVSSKVSESDSDNKTEVISEYSGINHDFMSAEDKTRDISKPEVQNVKTEAVNDSHLSDGNNNNLESHYKSNIEEEIQELHRKLSPQPSLNNQIADDSNFDSRNQHFSTSSSSIVSDISSLSTHSTQQTSERKKSSRSTRETAFDVDFFTSSTEEKQKEDLETSRNNVGGDDVVEVDQKSTNGATPVSKNTDAEVSNRNRKIGREESDSLASIENATEDSQIKPIIASRESFRSVRGLFEIEKDDKDISTKRTPSFQNRQSLNIERRSSDGSKKWRKSGSSWTVEEYLESDVNRGEHLGVINSSEIVSETEPASSSSDLTVNKRESISDENNMTAVVGKVSSFNIHRRGGSSHQDAPTISSSQNVSNNSDVYLIQDKSGDVYALQEVNTTHPSTHTFEGDNYSSFDTSSSSQQITYHQPVTSRDRSADLYVDGSGIDDSKAREVISAYLSTDPNLNQNQNSNFVSQTRTQTLDTRDDSFSSSTITKNPHSIVVHQGENVNGGYAGNTSGFANNNLLTNSTVAIDTRVDGRYDTSQTWRSGNNEPYTIGSGGEDGYKSSMVVTNLNTPNQKVYSTYSNSPSVDTSLDSQYVMRGGSHTLQPQQPLVVNVNNDNAGITPFRTTPVTVQTTTTALVGEKVDMQIDFPQVTTTAELAHSSSDEDTRKNYVIKSVTPKKSSLKISRDNDTSFGSNPELFYTRKETLTGDIIIGGNRKTVIDNRSNTDHTSKTYVVNNSSLGDRGRSKTQVSGKVKHHSPERFFKNAQLSLSRNKTDSSDDDSKKYRTITRVVLDSDNVDSYSRSGSESPQNRYRVMTNHSSGYQDNSLSEDDQYYEVATRRSEFDTKGSRKRYKVINQSHDVINSDSVRAHSSPKPYTTHSKSFEENYVTKLEHKTTPSHYKTLPANSKRHKTVIQLDLGQNGIKEKGRSESEFSAPASRIYRTKSVDSLSRDLKVFHTNDDVDSRKMWRTGRARSVGSSSDESSSDFEGSGPYNLAPTLVNTSKQKRGNKTYVVKSTMDDQSSHPAGWFKSTIDINEKHPERYDQNFVIQNSTSNHNQSFSQSERITQQRMDTSSSQAMEKSVYYVREASQPSYTNIPVQASPDSGRGTEFYSSDGETESRKKFERVERIYEVRTEPELPEQFLDDSVSKDMRVLRGKILIQNRMDESSHFEDDFEENVNLFDNSFHLGKDNPLYASDSDLMAALQREEQQEMSRHVTQDITYDQVDSMTQKYKTSAKAEITPRPKRKQNLSTLLLAKLANVDSKDIRQTINVEHHNEEIVGDINFIHADGKKSGSKNTSNFDSVTENVELALQQGKAFIIIKVIAERIIPTDLEFNIWRKSQAIVTRQIEIDLLANEQRRRFYHHVMDTQGRPALETGSGRGHMTDMSQERQLNSMETLKLFSQILDIADGQGEKDHTTMRTKQEMGQLPSGADLLY